MPVTFWQTFPILCFIISKSFHHWHISSFYMVVLWTGALGQEGATAVLGFYKEHCLMIRAPVTMGSRNVVGSVSNYLGLSIICPSNHSLYMAYHPCLWLLGKSSWFVQLDHTLPPVWRLRVSPGDYRSLELIPLLCWHPPNLMFPLVYLKSTLIYHFLCPVTIFKTS